MFKRLKKTLVESYVGAIGLGWLFAQGILHFSFVFTAPLADWMSRTEYLGLTGRAAASAGFLFKDAVLELGRSFSLLLLGYVLLRWLYFKPLEKETTTLASEGC
jgi:hypothetical protein